MSDEYSIGNNFQSGKITAGDYTHKMRRVAERETEIEQTSSHMSAEWWHREADRYCGLHIAAQQRILRLERHLRRLVDWGHGSDAPDDAIRDWDSAREFLGSGNHAAMVRDDQNSEAESAD